MKKKNYAWKHNVSLMFPELLWRIFEVGQNSEKVETLREYFYFYLFIFPA